MLDERRIWLISDVHRNHQRLVELAGRPPDFTEIIMNNWKRLVSPLDTIIDLGDVQVGRQSTFSDLTHELPGTKILIRGNHDHERPSWYLARGYSLVTDGIRIGRILLTHKPCVPIPDMVKWNIHGHHHAGNHREFEVAGDPYYEANRDRYILLEIESRLKPVLFSEFCLERNIMT